MSMLLKRNWLGPLATRRGFRGLANVVAYDGGLVYNGSSYSFRWLRDSCQCPECVHPSTHQKLHRSTDIAEDIHPVLHGIRQSGTGVSITWSSGHRSDFSTDFLQTYSTPVALGEFHHDIEQRRWDKDRISSAQDLFMSYEDMKKPSGMLAAMTQLTRYGLVFVTGVSIEKTSHDTCEARKLAEMFSETRSTLYGDLWDVINIRDSRNIAYTNLYLGLHMDLL